MPADVSALSLERPRSLKAALAMLASDPALTPIAGCTDVYVGLHFGTMPQRRFINLWDLKELRGISVDGNSLRIGALTTYTEIIESKIVQKRVPMLVAASREVGGAQIQNRGTLGGNVANASPAGDTLPVLAAANARIVLRSHTGTRTVAFDNYYTGYRKSVRQPDELIVAIEMPRIDGEQWWRKVGTRRAQAISKIMIGAVRGRDLRIAFGSVAPTVVLARKTAAVLASGGSIADAQAALRTKIAPIDDVRSTGEYRVAVAGNLLAQFWKETK
ncbi:MAG TPA: FAD binding domain-containing protein [Vicinamibacterales bacterium]|nr:FAD binding domain-containing protein [Vicinamibacterales bacterium]